VSEIDRERKGEREKEEIDGGGERVSIEVMIY
jgi:hypothetical protein